MAVALVSAIIDELVLVIAENAVQKLRLGAGVEIEVKKLQSKFEAIRCVLEDAEKKQIEQSSVKRWLARLKEVSYDMEDVLNEWKTEILKLEIDGVGSVPVAKKVRYLLSNLASSCREVVMGHPIAARIKEINEEVDAIVKEKDIYQLAASEIKQPRRLESTSFVDVSKLLGRDEVKNKIVNTLLHGDGIQTIHILGMGGLGKTALAQLIFNDNQLRTHFNKFIWVCVSDHYNLDRNKVAMAILQSLDQASVINLQNATLENLLAEVCKKLKSGKFLLVLDDVWTDHDEDWEPLRAAFQHGMPGSRVLVTTRKESVATGMGFSQVFHLEKLSDDVCWLILCQWAFMGKDNDLCEKLEDIGREIAKKCKGLPLAAKTLGGLLREKKRRNEWQNILNSDTWKLDVAKEYIFTPLLLSYYDLPSQIRPCLLYCAIFPKDFRILRTQLIEYWMALGYLGMEEEKGEEYFKYLVSRSFFQEIERDGDGNIFVCKMHDLVHDFIQYLTNEEIVMVEVNSSENVRWDLSSKKAHHLRLTMAKKDRFPVSINGIEKLRSLVTFYQQDGDVSREALQALFKAAKCLRFLEFWSVSVNFPHLKVEEITNEIGELIHLRFLNLSYAWNLKELPEAVCELHNLQYLILVFCVGLEKLPDGIGKLINLRSLDTRFCDRLNYYPKGIGRSISLRKLTSITARVDGNGVKEFSLGDLENLDLLQGFLCMRLVGNVVDEEDAKRAELHKKIHLTYLNIVGFEQEDLLSFLQALNPPPNLHMNIGGTLCTWTQQGHFQYTWTKQGHARIRRFCSLLKSKRRERRKKRKERMYNYNN